MGNAQTKSAQTLLLSNKKKNFSFNAGDFSNFNMQKIKPTNNISSSLDIKKKSTTTAQNQHQLVMPSILTRHSSSLVQTVVNRNKINSNSKMTIKQQNARLQKLNKNNDQLRKQLIQINVRLAKQLQKKKVIHIVGNKSKQKKAQSTQKKTEQQRSSSSAKQQNNNNNIKITILKKQLTQAYSQVSTYKRQVQKLKKNNPQQSSMKISQCQDKIIIIDQQINTVTKSINSIKQIVNKQRVEMGEFQSEMEGSQVQQMRRQIVMLKQRLKQIKQVSRNKQKDEKMRHQLLIQMERKLREVNGEYMPEFKGSSGNQNDNVSATMYQQGIMIKQSRIESIKSSRIKGYKGKQQQKDYMYNNKNSNNNNNKNSRILTTQQPTLTITTPQFTDSQFQHLLLQHARAKKQHQQDNKKIDIQLRRRNQFKSQRQLMQQRTISMMKEIEGMVYKRDRCMQMLMQNVQSDDDRQE